MEIVSACLVGVACRYNGAGRTDPAMLARFGRGDLYPVCPELAGGLNLPRPPAEICGSGGGAAVLDGRARVKDRDGRDVTEAFVAGAEATLRLARSVGASEAFMMAQSPSCGVEFIHDGSFSGRLVPGDGVAAALLLRNKVRVRSVDHGAAPAAVEAPAPGSQPAGTACIRSARPADSAALARLAGQLGYPCADAAVRRRMERYLGHSDMTIIVAEEEGEVVGWTSLEIVEHFYLEPYAEIAGFVIEEKRRGRGIGRLMMDGAERWAASEGVQRIQLRANAVRTGAHRFYEALGFERTKESYVYSKQPRG